jgi:hypothetical protein
MMHDLFILLLDFRHIIKYWFTANPKSEEPE